MHVSAVKTTAHSALMALWSVPDAIQGTFLIQTQIHVHYAKKDASTVLLFQAVCCAVKVTQSRPMEHAQSV